MPPLQRITASPDPVSRGGALTIGFKHPDMANTTVTLTLWDSENGTTTTLSIDLDATGSGTTAWTVPQGWGAFVVISHPSAQDVTVAVTSPPGLAPHKRSPVKGAKKRR